MTFCAVCGRKASHQISLTPSLRRDSDYMKQLIKRLKLSTRQADRFTSLPNPHICFRHFADGCVRMVDGRPKIACSKFFKGEVTSFKNMMDDEERRALQVYTKRDNQINSKSRGSIINRYDRSIVYQEVGPPRKCAVCYMVTLNSFTIKQYIPQAEIDQFINCFDLGDTPLSEWEESFASKQYVCCHHFPNDVRESINEQPKILNNAILEDGFNDSFESDENENIDLHLKGHEQKKDESSLHTGSHLLVSVSPNSMRDSLIPTVPVTTLNQPSNSEPSSKLMKYDMEVKSVGCSLDDVINSVASGALGDSDRKRAALEKLSRQAQQATCSICTRTFSNRTQYLNHMETEHYCGPRNYAYGGGRTSNVFYKQDKYTTKSGKPAGYPCPVTGCTQSYVYQNGLYRHLNSVHVMETYDIGEIAGIFSTVWPSKPSLKAVQMMVEDRGIIAAASEIAGL